METIVIHKVEDILKELNRMYPTGFILGDAYAIVGDMGLIISWFDKDQNRHDEKYKPDERIPITEIRGAGFLLSLGSLNPVIHHSHFKGFIKHKS